MATIVKEKNRKKKKSKNRNGIHHSGDTEESVHPNLSKNSEPHLAEYNDAENACSIVSKQKIDADLTVQVERELDEELFQIKNITFTPTSKELHSELPTYSEPIFILSESVKVRSEESIPKADEVPTTLMDTIRVDSHFQDISPSAPMLDTPIDIPEIAQEQPMEEQCTNPKIIRYIPIEEAKKIFRFDSMVDLKNISDYIEGLIAVRSYVDLEHPIIDLINNFRSSLASVERERIRISKGYREEQKARSELWKVEKQALDLLEKCPCGANVDMKLVYEQAEFQNEKLAAARLRLNSLLKDVVESYCCYQHEAILGYCEIEDIMSLVVKRSKESIRNNLAFVLDTLNMTDDCGEVFTYVMQNWAANLAAALFHENPDIEDLIFFTHLLFRQTRSVRWAEHVVNAHVVDVQSAARFVAYLDVLLVHPRVQPIVGISTDVQVGEETWEELYPSGGAGGVGEGRLRECDLFGILKSLPLRDLIGSIMLLSKEEMEGNHGHEWTGMLAFAMVTSISGVRVLLDVLGRALPLYRGYRSVYALLCQLALSTLQALEALHLQSRRLYPDYSAETMLYELEGCFVAGYQCLPEDRHKLPVNILSDEAVTEYCQTLMSRLHEKKPREMTRLNLSVRTDACANCVRILVHVASQKNWPRLSEHVLDFLFKTGIRRPAVECAGGCGATAREMLPHLLFEQPNLHTGALLKLANLNEVEIVDAALVQCLAPAEWRPVESEVVDVLLCWSVKCPALLPHLLELIDCRPHKGIELNAQLAIGTWLSTYINGRSESTEWAWSTLRRLCLHRACWGLSLDSFSPASTNTLFEMAFALLASDWGHSVPLVCSEGVGALQRLASARPADAVHCLDNVMRVMAQSPESVSLTPEFTDICGTILNARPGLVRRAFGCGGVSGQEMLQRLILKHVNDKSLSQKGRQMLLSAWLHALWKPSLPPASRVLLETAMLACREWNTLAAHVTLMLEGLGSQVVREAVAQAGATPLLTTAVVRAARSAEVHSGLLSRLLPLLVLQRHRGERVHVDKALKQIESKISSDELVIHRAASSVLAAPLQSPSHLILWCIFFDAYLHRPPENTIGGTPAAGPLFFSGIIKAITLNQLKKRLQETVTYHRNAAAGMQTVPIEVTAVEEKPDESIMADLEEIVFPPLTLKDLTGVEEEDIEESDDSDAELRMRRSAAAEWEKAEHKERLISYHKAAEKMLMVFERWLADGDSVHAPPHQADIERYLSEEDLNTAWKVSYEYSLSKLPPEAPSAIPMGRVRPPALTCYDKIIRAVNTFKHETTRRRRPTNRSQLPSNIDFNDVDSVIKNVQKLLLGVEKLVLGWTSEAERARVLDKQLWAAVSRLRVRRPLPPVRLPCPKGCKPLMINVQKDEWCLSMVAMREIEENRTNALQALQRLTQPKSPAARVSAGLIAISRRINDKEIAFRVLETLYCSLHEEKAPAHRSLMHFISYLAEEWVCCNGEESVKLLERWSLAGAYALCSAVVRPLRPHVSEWRIVYLALLRAPLPPTSMFSYMSRFEMTFWASMVEDDERREVVGALKEAVIRWANMTDAEYQMLIEMAGMHSLRICCETDVLSHVLDCNRAAVVDAPLPALPPGYLAHLPSLVSTHFGQLEFCELTQVLSDLGTVWGRARGSMSYTQLAACAPHVGALLQALVRAHLAAAVKCGYKDDYVGHNAWVGAYIGWLPWVEPHTQPLLPITAETERYATALDGFVLTFQQVIENRPSCKIYLLRHMWVWVVETCSAAREKDQECRMQALALLAKLRRMPWQLQWFSNYNLQFLVKVSKQDAEEVNAWVCHTLACLQAETWLNGVEEPHLVEVLPTLFQIFISKYMPLPTQTLDEACRLPWNHLSAAVNDELLKNFYEKYHSPLVPYHEQPHFKLILTVSQLSEARLEHQESRVKRCSAMANWVRAAIVPALLPHMSGFTQRLLDVLQQIAPSIEYQENHMLELLSNAMTTLSIESAATEALPVWQNWVRSCGPHLRRECMRAAGTLGSVDVAAPLVDTLAELMLADKDGHGWREVSAQLRGDMWAGATSAVQRAHYHAAYALLLAKQPPPNHVRRIVVTLRTFTVSFVENEVIISLWICALCRLAREFSDPAGPRAEEPTTEQASDPRPGDLTEVVQDVRSLLLQWAELKRSLFQVVTLQYSAVPTQRHRLLCYLALCILTPSQSTNTQASIKDYETACQSANSLGINPGEIVQWGRRPSARRLPQLAVLMFPQNGMYFKDELQLAGTN